MLARPVLQISYNVLLERRVLAGLVSLDRPLHGSNRWSCGSSVRLLSTRAMLGAFNGGIYGSVTVLLQTFLVELSRALRNIGSSNGIAWTVASRTRDTNTAAMTAARDWRTDCSSDASGA